MVELEPLLSPNILGINDHGDDFVLPNGWRRRRLRRRRRQRQRDAFGRRCHQRCVVDVVVMVAVDPCRRHLRRRHRRLGCPPPQGCRPRRDRLPHIDSLSLSPLSSSNEVSDTSAEFEGDEDILGGYCHREEEDCTGAAAKCCNVEHVTDEVERVIGDSKVKMGQGGGCRGHC